MYVYIVSRRMIKALLVQLEIYPGDLKLYSADRIIYFIFVFIDTFRT